MLYWQVNVSKMLRFGWGKDPQLGWLAPKLLRAYAMFFKHRYTVERRQNLLLLLDQESYIDRWLLVRGSWEQEQLDFLIGLAGSHCRDRPAVFVDAGAHGGLYSLVMRRLALFDRILAFEPDPRNFAQLQANLLMNDAFDSIEVFKSALSDTDGEISLMQEGNRAVTQVAKSDATSQIVQCARLDSVLAVTGHAICCKIDVEGHEWEVLRGMSGLLESNDIVLQVEIHDARAEQTLADLKEQGFDFVTRIAPHDYFLVRKTRSS